MKPQKRILVSAVSSGAGKTTISIAIMAVLKRRGISVQPFKVGPDYIDKKYHEIVTGNRSYSLDGWMLDKGYIVRRFGEESLSADVSLIEGVMGLYDGYDGITEKGSSAQIAKWLSCPVILVVDARSMARSAGAVVKGFEAFDTDITIAGIVFNRVGSTRHGDFLRQAVENNCNAPVLGCIPRDETIVLPSRHLGLVTSAEEVVTNEFLDRLIHTIEKNVDIDKLLDIASLNISHNLVDVESRLSKREHQPSRCTVAVAYDDAFCFYYHDNFRIMEEMGIIVLFFSPLNDFSLPKGIDALYIGGGYPEVYVEKLEKNITMRKEIQSFAECGGVIYAECGGLMYISQKIRTTEMKEYEMVGALPCTILMLEKRQALGYVFVEIADDCLVGKKGELLRGHEYHYSCIEDMPAAVERKYRIRKRGGEEEREEGYSYNNVLASYVHLHFGTSPAIVNGFLKK